jgi:hypothetical protein
MSPSTWRNPTFKDSTAYADNTAVLHHKAHVTCTNVTLSNPVPTIGPRSINSKILPSVQSTHLYFRMDFRTNRDYSLIRHKLIFITPCLLRGTNYNFIHNSGYTKSLNPRLDYVKPVVGNVAMGQVFLRELPFFLVNIIPPVLQTQLHLHVANTRRTNGRILTTFQKETIFWELKSIGYKVP